MTYRLRFLLASVAAIALLPPLGAACNPQVATVLASDDSGTADGGGVGASCTEDNGCYEDPAISSPRGRCVAGKCVCEPGIAMTASGKCGDPVTTGNADAGPDLPAPECTSKGGVCSAVGDSAPPNMRPAKPGEAQCAGGGTCWLPLGGNVPVCYNDQGCNPSPSISALYGKCMYGLCHCAQGYTVQLDGKCNTAPPPACGNQGGSCRPNSCMADELRSADATHASCPDDGDQLCCNKTASCVGGGQEAAGAGWVKVDFDCCSKTTGQNPPICVNGWQTCPAGTSPVPKGSICN